MHDITDLPAWERLFKKIVWKQLGDMEGKKILDFGSGEGITANHFAEKMMLLLLLDSHPRKCFLMHGKIMSTLRLSVMLMLCLHLRMRLLT